MINTWVKKKPEDIAAIYEDQRKPKQKVLNIQPNSTKNSNVTNITNIIYNFNINQIETDLSK
jgi:hypothetical protein